MSPTRARRGGARAPVKVTGAEHLTTIAELGQLPPPTVPEIAFLGRSNVGKSSLLNKLVSRKQLARTSGTPGKTRQLELFRIELAAGAQGARRVLHFVDLPGYGYARVSQSERARWQRLIEGYLGERECLRVAILLQDLRRDASEDETLLLDWLAERDVDALVAITKSDKLKPMRRAARLRELRQQLGLPAERVIATSAQTNDGIADLWRAILARA